MLAAFLNENRRQPDGSIWPGIVFGPNCQAVVDSILSLRWKEQLSRSGEDPREKFVDKNKHGFDGLTYGLVGVPPPDLGDMARLRRRSPPSGNQSAQAMLEALEA
jgi:hypothetical protein